MLTLTLTPTLTLMSALTLMLTLALKLTLTLLFTVALMLTLTLTPTLTLLFTVTLALTHSNTHAHARRNAHVSMSAPEMAPTESKWTRMNLPCGGKRAHDDDENAREYGAVNDHAAQGTLVLAQADVRSATSCRCEWSWHCRKTRELGWRRRSGLRATIPAPARVYFW